MLLGKSTVALPVPVPATKNEAANRKQVRNMSGYEGCLRPGGCKGLRSLPDSHKAGF